MKRAIAIGLMGALLAWSSHADARPIAPSLFCATYSDSPACLGGQPACTFCHTVPPARNAFGTQVSEALLPTTARPLSDRAFVTGLPEALRVVEAEDADADGFTNIDEIVAGTYPAEAASRPSDDRCLDAPPRYEGFDVCRYDPLYVFKKISIQFCGESPALEATRAFSASSDREAALHAELDRCLDSEAWMGRDGSLWRIGFPKVRPIQAAKAGQDAGVVPLADYYDDLNLFAFTQIDNHDAREVLTANYFVARIEDGPTQYLAYDKDERSFFDGRQRVVRERRAGLLTTRWNLVFNTMFSAVPRTTAAQAYRAFLGLDIARLEGLMPVADEPADYDRRGVGAETCKTCHSTLDPLSYPFTRYAGLSPLESLFSYDAGRMTALAALEGADSRLADAPENGSLFGRPVRDLVEWAEVAVTSEAFARATVMDYWRLLFGEAPRPDETEEFNRLSRDFMTTHAFGVERMLHDLIRTEAYGVP